MEPNWIDLDGVDFGIINDGDTGNDGFTHLVDAFTQESPEA